MWGIRVGDRVIAGLLVGSREGLGVFVVGLLVGSREGKVEGGVVVVYIK